jgi:hypothetical protein
MRSGIIVMRSRIVNKKHFRIALIAATIVILIPVIAWAYYIISLNIWIHNTPPELDNYAHPLIIERENTTHVTEQDDDVTNIERVIIREIRKDRIVINLSRDGVRFSPFRRKAYVKIYLETAVPEKNGDKRVRVKLLHQLRRRDGQWYLASTSNLLIQ